MKKIIKKDAINVLCKETPFKDSMFLYDAQEEVYFLKKIRSFGEKHGFIERQGDE